MREASKHVTVLLDGQGADEMMAGYIPYYAVYLRQLRAQGATVAAAELAKSLDVLYRLGRHKLKARLRLRKSVPTTRLMGREFVRQHAGEKYVSEGANLKKRLVEDLFHNSLPSLLRYEDKNTMRFSLEGRVPFLDKEVVKFVFSLSDEAIIKDGWNKRVLRDATRGLLPESINRRRNKIGFTTPQVEWFMRLKNHFYNIFLSESFANRPYVNQTEVIAAFEGWIKGANDVDTMTFWRLINLELWLREFFDERDEDADAEAAARSAHVKTDYEPNERRPLDLVTARGESVRRYPVRTELFAKDDDLDARVLEHVDALLRRAARPPGPSTPRPRPARGGSSSPRRSSRSPRAAPTSCGTSRSAARRGCCRGTSRARPPASASAARSRCSSRSRRPACRACSTPRPAAPSARSSGARACSTSSSATRSTPSTAPPSTPRTRATSRPSSPPRTPTTSPPGSPPPSASGCPSRGARPSRGPSSWTPTTSGATSSGADVPGPWDRFEEMFADNPLGQGSEQTPMAMVFLRDDA